MKETFLPQGFFDLNLEKYKTFEKQWELID